MRDAPPAFGDFRALLGVRTPSQLVRHATLGAGDGNDPGALPVRRENGAYALSMRDVNHDGLPDLGFSVEKLNPNLGLAAPSTTLSVRGAVPTSSGAIVLRGSTTMGVSP